MKLSEQDREDLREIRNNVTAALIVSACASVTVGIGYLVTVLPPSIKALQDDVAQLAPRITSLEQELVNHRVDIERLKEAIRR